MSELTGGYELDHSYAWSLSNEERFEIMVLTKLYIERIPVWSHWRIIEECFAGVASPIKCLDVVRHLREDATIRYFCKGCGANVNGPMWCECGEFALRRE